jgi:hypothetical protein
VVRWLGNETHVFVVWRGSGFGLGVDFPLLMASVASTRGIVAFSSIFEDTAPEDSGCDLSFYFNFLFFLLLSSVVRSFSIFWGLHLVFLLPRRGDSTGGTTSYELS